MLYTGRTRDTIHSRTSGTSITEARICDKARRKGIALTPVTRPAPATMFHPVKGWSAPAAVGSAAWLYSGLQSLLTCSS